MPGDGTAPLLDSYAAIARARRPRDLEETALRTRSSALRELLAHLASAGLHSYEQIAALPEEQFSDLEARWAMALGRVVGFQKLAPGDTDAAIRILQGSTAHAPSRHRLSYRRVLAELLYAEERWSEVHALLVSDDTLRAMGDSYLRTDLMNPFSASPYADADAWWDGFGSRFSGRGISRPALDPQGPAPFDRLRAHGDLSTVDGPLVSVIMTAYRPQAGPLTTSVRSILEQTWRNLELIIVDDCSPEGHSDVLDAVAEMDDRVRVIRMPVNGGTYLARNAGMAVARGEIITGQDDDDWSHPERIARQVQPLLETPDVPATRSRCLTVNENLVMQRPGYDPIRPNASSLMFRRETIRRVGGFQPSRRGADSELHHRIEMVTGGRVLDLEAPLAIVRIRTDSLSRSDFRPGWHHPDRKSVV